MKWVFSFVIVLTIFLGSTSHSYAQPAPFLLPETLKGDIVKVASQHFDDSGELEQVSYQVTLDNGQKIVAIYQLNKLAKLELSVGTTVVVVKTNLPNAPPSFQIVDVYRLPVLLYFLIAFAVIAILIVGKKGVGSLLGLFISLFIILYGLVPLILKGYDPLSTTIFFCLLIIVLTTYLAHGVSKKTTIALVSTFISLLITLGISVLCIQVLRISGFGNENVYDLYLATNNTINAKGLLLSGIIIATLGALNDVTITQAVTLFEIKKMNKDMSFFELVKKGMSIGQEHGASMVNTIVLAYAGSSLFVFIFFIINPQKQPIWAILNNEFIVEEIVKTLGGTMGILLALPIVTVLAAWILTSAYFRKKNDSRV